MMGSEFDDILAGSRGAFEGTFGEDVVYTPQGGSAVTITAVVDRQASDFQSSQHGEEIVRRTVLSGRPADIGGWGADDVFTVDGAAYRVLREVRRDGMFVDLELERVIPLTVFAREDRARRARL